MACLGEGTIYAQHLLVQSRVHRRQGNQIHGVKKRALQGFVRVHACERNTLAMRSQLEVCNTCIGSA